MKRMFATAILATCLLTIAPTAAVATEITLHAPQYPDRTTVPLDMVGTARAPDARVEAKVEFRDTQAAIEMKFKDMKPAVLFGGDITAYVVWAVARDGRATNLGELTAPDANGKATFATGLKSFALLITAEPYYLVRKPSEMVMFTNAPPTKKRVPSDDFSFAGLVPAAKHQLDTIVNVAWDSDQPLELIQAEKAYELAERIGAESYAPDIFTQATISLNQSRSLAGAGRKRKTSADYALRSVALSNDAIGISERKIEAAELEAAIAERRAEIKALEARASETEQALTTAERALAEASDQTASLIAERAQLEAAMGALRTEQAALMSAVAGLKQDRDELASRLDLALAHVADTRSTARGTIVNLPDILFDLNESTLKPETRQVIAKLAGILLIMGDLNTRIEGHTDSTGSLDYNMALSEARATSVRDFLFEQGIAADRMTVAGYGPGRPIADNGTGDGRARNRRVEIVIAEGEIAEATGTD